MLKYLKYILEIIATPRVEIETKSEDDFQIENEDVLPMLMPRLSRRTYKVFCMYCHNVWCDIHGRELRSRVCLHCTVRIQNEACRKEKNVEVMQKTHMKMQLVHESIIDIGMHPCRVRQTLLPDTLHMFLQD